MRTRKTVRGVAENGILDFAREQRRSGNAAECLLWGRLKSRALGVKFRRQHAIDGFVLDFYSAETLLAIEIDGTQHSKTADYDRWREEVVARGEIEFLRFRTRDVLESLDDVVAMIKEAVRVRLL